MRTQPPSRGDAPASSPSAAAAPVPAAASAPSRAPGRAAGWAGRLLLAGGLALAACQWLIFVHAPLEQTMGPAQKIFYLHLPVAWWCFACFFLSCVTGALYLKSRRPRWDLMCAASAEVGMVCASLALVTGSVWARHSWGVWWTWDPRLTTALVLWFLYAATLILRGMPMPPERRSTLCAVVAVVGFLDVPLVFLSARLWRSIHPAVFASRGGGLEPEMAVAAVAAVAAFGLICAGLMALRYGQLKLAARLDSLIFDDMAARDEAL